MKGKQVNEGLVNYNAKVEPHTKDLATALVDVLKGQGVITSQRELIEEMLVVYEAANPEAFKQARKLLALKAEAFKVFEGAN